MRRNNAPPILREHMTASIHDVVSHLDANRRFWTGWDASGSVVDPDGDLPTYRTGLPHRRLNGVLRVRRVSLDAAIAEAMDRLAGLPWTWWVGPDSDDGTAEGLVERGATHLGDLAIMAVDATTVADRPPPPGLAVERAVSPGAVEAFVRVHSESLRMPDTAVAALARHDLAHSAAHRDSVRLVGVVGGDTVGTTTVSLATAVAGLYFVATAETHRRHGTATALVLEALRLARETGHRIVFAHATGTLEAVYRGLGFRSVARYRLFELPIVEEPPD